MWTLMAWLVASAAEPIVDDGIDEIIVYGDEFARWDHTRWAVNSELILPMPLTLGADENFAFFTYALQTRMVLLCDKDGKLAKKKIEVLCEIEDIGILATSIRRWKKEKDREQVQRVLDQIDAKLTGAKIQLQVDFKGGVNNVDIEGITARNERERTNNENLRQLLLRMVAGFHMRIPDHAQRSGQWYEYNSSLMALPSITASRGSTTMVHTVSVHSNEGYRYQIVQTLGQGTSQVNLPNFDTTTPAATSRVGSPSSTDGPAGPSDFDQLPGTGSGKESSVELTYKLDTTGVAVFERDTGIMTERVWATRGMPTASSGSGTLNNPFRNVGRIQMLAEKEAHDVGVTGQVAWPFQQMEDLIPWVDLDVTPKR